jgi:hypothetical protein
MYWQALQATWPEAFEEPSEYVIQKTVGIFPLHAILTLVVEHVKRSNEVITREALTEVLMQLKDQLEQNDMTNFWHKDHGEAGKYAGAKGFSRIEMILRRNLPPLKPALTLGTGEK